MGALLLAAPLAVIGIYCIYPHPSYDCDCILSILLAVLLLRPLEPENPAAIESTPTTSWLRSFVAGAALVLPLFFKQNIGLPFLFIALTVIAILLLASLRRRSADTSTLGRATLLTVLAGTGTALLAAGVLLHFTVGLHNYVYWTVQFAAQRRLPGFSAMLSIYAEPSAGHFPALRLHLRFCIVPSFVRSGCDCSRSACSLRPLSGP